MEHRMSKRPLQDLLIETIRAPRDAAGRLIDMNAPRDWLWMALALMCVLNAILYSVSLQLSPPSSEVSGIVPAAFQSPILFTIFLFGSITITVFVLKWIGQSMGGQATLDDILILLTWLQVLRLLFQAAVLILSLVSLSLSALLVFGGSIYGIYILAAFIDRAHGFDNLLKALGVMVLALIAIAVGLSVILTVLGAVIMGGTGSV